MDHGTVWSNSPEIMSNGPAGLNVELPLGDDGDTACLVGSDGTTADNESFVFTEVDQHASAGMQVSGRRWHRDGDAFGVAGVADGLSGAHRRYLVAGGRGFLLGDGRLRYGVETVGEAYYRAQLGPWVAVSPDVMLIANPGYNRDRGPATLITLRVRLAN